MCGIDDYAKKSLSHNGQAFLLDFDAAKVSGELIYNPKHRIFLTQEFYIKPVYHC